MAREDDPCKHAYLTRAACPQCSKEPDSSMRRVTVYITAGGEVYHFDRNCHALEFGQQLVDDRGGTRAPIVPTFEDLVTFERGACNSCKGKQPS